MGVTAPEGMHHKSQIYDGFATIRSTRSRVRLKDSAGLGSSPASSNHTTGHSEYFTLRRNNKQTFLDNNNVARMIKNEPPNLDNSRIVFEEPIYAKVSPPNSNTSSPSKVKNERKEVHYDSIDIKPKKKGLHRKDRPKHRDKEPTEVRVTPIIVQDPEKVVDDLNETLKNEVKLNENGFHNFDINHEPNALCERMNIIPYGDEDFGRTLSESYSENGSTEATNDSVDAKEFNDDVLKELPSMVTRFHRSPQKYATLNMKRPKSIDLKPSYENPYYGSLNRAKIGHCSEPNTPVTGQPMDSRFMNDAGLPSPMELNNFSYPNAFSKRNGVRRSNSEIGSFYNGRVPSLHNTLPNYRHSVSVDVSSISSKNHVCCECVTGIPSNCESPRGFPLSPGISRSSGFSQTLDTLYESQDPKVGCQTILRSKPPVPWWDLAIRKSRYQSCPILDEAHVVSAFEQSLSNMTQRLQQLTATAERKDSELTQLRQTIELLRKQSIQAGLTSAHMASMGIKQDTVSGPNQEMPKQPSTTGSIGSGSGSNMTRHLSTDSVNSLNSLSSGCSSAQDKKHKKKGWLRSSFTKAFSRNAKISKTSKHSSLSHLSPSQDHSLSGDHQHGVIREGSNENSLENSHELLADTLIGDKKDGTDKDGLPNGTNEDGTRCDPQLVDELKKQLREKDLVLTDIRLEALSSAHQLESLKDTVIKMRNEMLNLKQNNERLQRLVRPKSLAGSHASLAGGANPPSPPAPANHDDSRRFSAADAQRPSNENDMDHRPQLDLDFITSTPTMDYKVPSPSDHPSLYRASRDLGLQDEGMASVVEGVEMEVEHGLLMTTGRLSGVDCEDSVLPAPKCRELAMGETYADLGLNENSADVNDGKKIAIAVYLGQPDTFPRYYEEVCESLNSCDSRFYSNRSSAAFNNCQPQPDFAAQESALSRLSLQNPPISPEKENGHDFQNRSNTNSLKSNKSSHSNYKNSYENGANTSINCNEFVIAYTYISGKTTWQNLDYTVRKTFKDYLSRIDPGTNLGLNTDSITSYHLGEATRGPEVGFPELLPCGYIIGMVKTLYICLQGVGSLAFDSLIPKNIVYRYVSLLSEHRRVILCGPSGTGKSYLAARLAEFHVARTAAHLNPAEAIATFNVEHKSSKELRQYLSNMAEQCGGEALLPSVLILDNLHHASALADVFSGLLGARRTNLPCIIGTMSQATCNTTNLQLHHNFRWLLTANHMEPVKGFLARYLRRKQLVAELGGCSRCPRLSSVLEWLPAVWQHVNSFLEAHSSSDVTVGPRLFLGCPLDLAASQAWFTSVWNYSVVPYLVEAAREGVALYGRRGAWADPAKYVRDTYPWPDPVAAQNLRGITLEDIGLDGNSTDNTSTNNQDPLLNMLMRLQEAANYSGNHSQDSDNASLDSNLTHDSSAGNEL